MIKQSSKKQTLTLPRILARALCLVAFLVALPSSAAQPAQWYFLDDPSNELTPMQALSKLEFIKAEQSSLPSISRGFTRSVSWLLTDVPVNDSPLNLHIRPGYLQNLSVFAVRAGITEEVFNGTVDNMSPPNFIFDLGLLSTPPDMLLVRLKTNTSHSLLADWITQEDIAGFRQQSAIKMSMYLALLSGAAALFALLGIRLYMLSYLVYAVYLTSIGVMTIAQQGFISWLSVGDFFVSDHMVGVAVGVSFFSMALFLALFFELKWSTTPKSYALSLLVMGLGLATALMAWTDWYVYLAPASYWLGYVLVANAMYLAFVSPEHGAAVKGRVFFLAFAQSCIAAFITMGTLNNWLPMTNLGLYAYSISVVLQALLFLLGFVERLIYAENKALLAAKSAESKAVAIAGEMTREVLEASEKLQASLEREQELRQGHEHFISTVNHEYRTPLAIIKGNLDMMKLRVPEMAEYSEKIDRAMNRLQQLFERTLRGYLQMNTNEIQMESVDINTFIQDVIKNSLVSSKVELSMPEKTVAVSTDTNLLRTAVLNLLDNAEKYGHAMAGEKVIEVSISLEDQVVSLRIANDYDPRAPKPSSSLFLPYVRGTKQAGVSGLGFGLYLVKSNIEKIGGKIRLLPSKTNKFTVLIELPGNVSSL
ncbi:MAG: hypothetical protein RI942_248 [Pseudomonadota bacterium]